MRRSADFAYAFRGTRGHAKRIAVALNWADNRADLLETKVGFVVSKKVGNSVQRHRIARQLRHIIRPQLEHMNKGMYVVVRALSGAQGATSGELAEDLAIALHQAERKSAVPLFI